MLQFLLYVSGDVHLNPGPPTLQNASHLLNDNLSLLHLNIRSIRNKIDLIESEFSNHDILCFTETHLSPDISDNHVLINSHPNLIRKDRITNYGGG